jgi:hypothetical protein
MIKSSNSIANALANSGARPNTSAKANLPVPPSKSMYQIKPQTAIGLLLIAVKVDFIARLIGVATVGNHS